MKTLIDRFRKDTLSSAELKALREQVEAATDATLEQELRRPWMEEEMDEALLSDERMLQMRLRVHQAIGMETHRPSLWRRLPQLAAAVLLPLFIALSLYLMYENRQLADDVMVVATAPGERATVTLPDGTSVMLNAESRLSYQPKEYHRKERKIGFSGEGYFQVRKHRKLPFTIDAKGLRVEVLGTTFNLQARQDTPLAELVLEEGVVCVEATKSHQQVVLHPAQKAVLDRCSGSIRVFDEKDYERVTAWKRGDMVFRNLPFPEVVRAVEERYRVRFHFVDTACPTDLFTGTLPLTDLNEMMDIIEKSFHLRAKVNDADVYLYRR